MRKIFLIILVAVSLIINAQEHLKLKGVEINGSYKSFRNELSMHGCSYGTNMYDFFMIKGNFAGEEMFFYPQVTSRSEIVYAVYVCSSSYYEKSTLYARYDYLDNLLSQKYGDGIYTEMGKGYYRNLYGSLVDGKASNTLVYEIDNGRIYLYIHKSDSSLDAGEVNLLYVDKNNEQLLFQESNTDI